MPINESHLDEEVLNCFASNYEFGIWRNNRISLSEFECIKKPEIIRKDENVEDHGEQPGF